MKKFISTKLTKKRKGDGSSSSSHHSESRSHEGVEEEQLHTLVPFIPADRMLEPHDNLLLTQEDLGKLYTLCTVASTKPLSLTSNSWTNQVSAPTFLPSFMPLVGVDFGKFLNSV